MIERQSKSDKALLDRIDRLREMADEKPAGSDTGLIDRQIQELMIALQAQD